MKIKTLGKWQIGIGIVAVIFQIINFVATGLLMNIWRVGTDNTFLLLFGIFAILTGRYTIKINDLENLNNITKQM